MVSCQTSKYYGSTHHDKALLARAPLTYALGFHTCAYEGDEIRREIISGGRYEGDSIQI